MGSPPNGLISQSWVWFVCHVLMGWHAAAWCLAKPYWRCNTNWKTTISCQNGVGCVCADNQARAGRVGLSGSGCVAESVSQQGLQLGEEWKGGEGAAAHWERATCAEPRSGSQACTGTGSLCRRLGSALAAAPTRRGRGGVRGRFVLACGAGDRRGSARVSASTTCRALALADSTGSALWKGTGCTRVWRAPSYAAVWSRSQGRVLQIEGRRESSRNAHTKMLIKALPAVAHQQSAGVLRHADCCSLKAGRGRRP
jgi:hypothetical protein